MASAGRRDREHREESFPLDALLERCPRCGAQAGERCKKKYSGEWIATAVPHQDRLDLARPEGYIRRSK